MDSENSKIEAIIIDIISKPENFMFFLGAGFSNEIGLPTASDLGKILEKEFKERGIITEELQENEKKDLDKLIGLLRNKGVKKKNICEVIEKELQIKKDILKVRSEKNFLGLFYRIINEGIFRKSREPIQINIATTNWDEALSKVFGEEPLSIFSGNEVRERLNIPSRKIVIYHLHGSIKDCDSMVLTEEEKSEIKERDAVLWNSFKAEVDKHRILFIGYGLADEDILNIYIKSRKNVGELKDYIIVNDDESKERIERKLKENKLENIATVIIINSLKFLEELARSMGLSLVTEKVELETEKRINEKLGKKRVIVTGYPASGLTTLYLNYLDKLPEKKLHLDGYKYEEDKKRSFDEVMDHLINNGEAAIIAPEYLYEVYLDSYLKSRKYSKDVINKLDEIRVKHYVSRDSAINFLEKLVSDSKYKDKFDKDLKNTILKLVKQEGFGRKENYPLKLLKDVFQDVNMKIAKMVTAKMKEKDIIRNIKETIEEKKSFKDKFEKIVDTAVVSSIVSTGIEAVYSFGSAPKDFQDFINKLIKIKDPIKSIFFDVAKAVIPFAFIGIVIYEIYEFVSNLRKGQSQVEAFLRFKKYWDSLTDSERRVLCYKLDMKNHLWPGKSEEFLNNMFTDQNWSNLKNEIDKIKDYVKQNLEEFRKKLDEFEKENGNIMKEISKINEDIRFIDDEIKSISEELQELKKRVEALEEQQYSSGAEKIEDIGRLNEFLSIEEKEEENLIGLGNSENDKIVKDKINEIISNSKDHVCIIEGEAGSGKTTLLYMVGRSLLDRGSTLYYIVEPSNFSFQKFRNLDAYALYDIRDPKIANEILGEKLREAILNNTPLARVIISVRASYIKDSSFIELRGEEGFKSVYEAHVGYTESILQEIAIRRLRNSFPNLSQDDLDEASKKLAKKSEGLPLYIKEAVKMLEEKGFSLEFLDNLPYGVVYYNYKGNALLDSGRYEDAIEFFDMGIQLNPDDPGIHNNKGNALFKMKRYREAIEEYDKAIERDPNNPDYHYNKGIALSKLGKYEEAIEEYDKAIELNPKDPYYHYNKGNALLDSKRHQEAIEEYDKAIELNPKDPSFHNNKGNALNMLQRHQEAIEEYDKAIELNPNNPDYHKNKGLTLYMMQRYQEAIWEFDKAIELDPSNPEHHYNKGLAQEKLNQHSKKL